MTIFGGQLRSDAFKSRWTTDFHRIPRCIHEVAVNDRLAKTFIGSIDQKKKKNSTIRESTVLKTQLARSGKIDESLPPSYPGKALLRLVTRLHLLKVTRPDMPVMGSSRRACHSVLPAGKSWYHFQTFGARGIPSSCAISDTSRGHRTVGRRWTNPALQDHECILTLWDHFLSPYSRLYSPLGNFNRVNRLWAVKLL